MPPVATAPWVSKGGNPNVDYVLDLETGSMTPLPQTILESLGEGQVRRYEGTVAAHDGLRLAYVGQAPDGSDQIFVANLDGTGIQQVTSDPAFARSPAWSPDGTKIAYSGHTANRGNGLFVVDLDSGQTTEVVDETDRWATPQFTPDGASLLFTGGTDMQPLLFTVPIASGQKKLLFEPGEGINDAGNGSISPDGSLVTYIGSGNPNPGGVGHCGPCRFVANVDGTGRRLIAGWMINAAGAWSPDGKRIVSMDDVGPTHRPFINVVDIATGHGTKVGYGRAAIWLDDHTLLVEVLGRR